MESDGLSKPVELLFEQGASLGFAVETKAAFQSSDCSNFDEIRTKNLVVSCLRPSNFLTTPSIGSELLQEATDYYFVVTSWVGLLEQKLRFARGSSRSDVLLAQMFVRS